jgi:hypothetical protein
MLDISFYKDDAYVEAVDISDQLFEQLAYSQFSKIGDAQKIILKLDEEETELPLVPLISSTRYLMITFLHQFIVAKLEKALAALGEKSTGKDYKEYMFDIQTLIRLLRCVERADVKYLQRVSDIIQGEGDSSKKKTAKASNKKQLAVSIK